MKEILAHRRHYGLLDVFPFDVVKTARQPEAVVELFFAPTSKLFTVSESKVGGAPLGRSRCCGSKSSDRRRGRQRIVATTGPEALGISRVVHVARIGLGTAGLTFA